MINNSNSLKQRLQSIKRFVVVTHYLFRKRYKSIYIGLKASIILFATGFFLLLGLFLSVYFGAFGAVPNYSTLSNIQNNEASSVYDKNGQLLGRYYKENRILAEAEELPDILVQALVATEDERFFEHSGVDTKAMLRVLFKTILMQDRRGGGGSTLSQQLAKNLFPRQDHGILSVPVFKIKEIIVARRLEKIYSKEELILFYLNTVPFGRDIYGVKVASNRFFNTTVESLKVEQAAVLVGMLKANTSYDPVINPERSKSRRNVVLKQMAKNGVLNYNHLDSLTQLELKVDYIDITDEKNRAAYFKAHLEKELKEILQDKLTNSNQPIDLYTSGLIIKTTLDAKLQAYAEQAVKEEMVGLQKAFDTHWKGKSRITSDLLIKSMKASNRYQTYLKAGLTDEEATAKYKESITYRYYSPTAGKWRSITRSPLDSLARALTTLHCGMVSIEPRNGAIRAWVGGVDYASFQYDHILSKRQVGSVFKPIVYLAALEKGVEPCTYQLNEQTTYVDYDNWTPKNADNKYGGYYSMPGALANSVNTMAVEYLFLSGLDTVVEYAHQLGIKSNIEHVPAIALGAVEASVLEMAQVYSTIHNKGKRVEPYFIESIEDATGKVIYKRQGDQENIQVVLEENALLMREMLKNVVDKGTAQRAKFKYHVQSDIAGKTGTTSDQADGWFVGMTPSLVTAVWVGGEHPSIRWRDISLGQGANTALPVWANYTKRIEKSSSRKYTSGRFEPLDSIQYARIDCPFYKESLIDTLENFMPWEWIKQETEQLLKKQSKQQVELEKRKRIEERRAYFRDLFKKRKKGQSK